MNLDFRSLIAKGKYYRLEIFAVLAAAACVVFFILMLIQLWK